MKRYISIKQIRSFATTEEFEGTALEDKVRRVIESGEPVEAVSPMVYTERKDGVRPDTNIRTDKWEVAQEAMNSIADGIRQKRQEKLIEKSKEMGGKTAEPTVVEK